MDDLFLKIILALLLLALFTNVYIAEKRTDEYAAYCRSAGGTPTYSFGEVNCAQIGFIDITK